MAQAKRKQRRLPKLSSPYVARMHPPLTREGVKLASERLVQVRADKAEWHDKVRAAYAKADKDGVELAKADVPSFPKSKLPNPNAGRMTEADYAALLKEYDDVGRELMENPDSKRPYPIFPPVYIPVEQDLIAETGCGVLRKGQERRFETKKIDGIDVLQPPSDWDESKFGSWVKDGEPSLLYVDWSAPRRVHATKPEHCISDSAQNIVTIGDVRYLVGTGGHKGSSVFLIAPSAEGKNVGNVDAARKEMCLAGAKGLVNLVFRFEDKSNHGECVEVEMDRLGNKNWFMPGQALTPGYLYSGNDELSPSQIRKLEDGKVKFKPLLEPIKGKEINWKTDLWPAIQLREGRGGSAVMRGRATRLEKAKTPQDKTLENATTHCRMNAISDGHAFGFRNANFVFAPYYRYSSDGEVTFGLVIGIRSNYDLIVTKQDVKSKTEAAIGVAEPKATKKKSVKAAKKKVTKKVVAKKKVVEAAPPVEHDTNDEPELSLVSDDEGVDVSHVDKQQRDEVDAQLAQSSEDD